MILAPVLIPTLNRCEHLKRCLTSLSRCTLAEQTEVYVALDYPPSKKYIEGWQKTRKYLFSVGNMNFKKIHIIERSENYGTWKTGEKGNATCLINEISKRYDRYIFTEDDNVFAPNFLEFMNKGLNLFEKDDKVFAIAGYRWWFDVKYDTSTFFRQSVDYTPWGVARWTNKDKDITGGNWFKKQLTIKNVVKLIKKKDFLAIGSLFQFACKEHFDDILIDHHYRVIMAVKNQHMIIPTSQLVKNIGLDGSGASMPANKSEIEVLYNLIPLSTEKSFDFLGNGYEYYAENNKIYKKNKEWQGQFFFIKRCFIKMLKYLIKG